MSNSTRTTAVLVVVAGFIAGLFVGIAGDRFYLIRSHQLFPRRAADFTARHVVDRLDRDLHLSAEQRTAIQKIVDTHHAKIEATWNNVRPQVRQELDATNAEIDKILTPDQRTKFREIRERIDRRRGSRRGR